MAKPLCLAATANKHQFQLALSHTMQARRACRPTFLAGQTIQMIVSIISQPPLLTRDFLLAQDLLSVSL